MSELVCLEIGVVLWLVHVLLQGALGTATLPQGYLFTPRDAPATPKGPLLGRATRALHNYIENFVPFLALDLGLIVAHRDGGFGPSLWILARAVYIPLYLFGIPFARTAAWGVGVVGLVMMFFRLAF